MRHSVHLQPEQGCDVRLDKLQLNMTVQLSRCALKSVFRIIEAILTSKLLEAERNLERDIPAVAGITDSCDRVAPQSKVCRLEE